MKNLVPNANVMMLICLLTFGCKMKTTFDNPIKEQSTITTDLVSEKIPISGFRTVYHIQLNSDEDEVDFVEIAAVFNDLTEELGYRNVKFNFWKFTGEKQGKYGYIFESNWPNKETFDKVFKDEEFKFFLSKWYPKFESMIAEGVYNKYILLK